jgi:hypothetical protein
MSVLFSAYRQDLDASASTYLATRETTNGNNHLDGFDRKSSETDIRIVVDPGEDKNLYMRLLYPMMPNNRNVKKFRSLG